ncbi:hypothetical protein N0V95_008475 [Ascochyta clinopodiicola]|nr:hypothetical protein N0V95_008475 [Ascochyta clinopodiicola]
MFDKLREKSRGKDEKRASFDGQQQEPAPAYASASSSQPPPPFQTRFASMSMHAVDDLRFLHFPPQVIDQCRATILGVWKDGIQKERMYGISQEFKLSGYPWSAMGSAAMEACRLIAALLGTLRDLGWVLSLNTDVSKNADDKDSLIFRHQSPAPAPCDWCSISFSRGDRIRLIDASPEVCQALPVRLGQEWVTKVSEYAPGIQDIKLHGYPWTASGKDTMRVRELLLTMMETLEEEGWTVYASIDQSVSGGQNTSEADTIPEHQHASANDMPRIPTALLREARAIDPFLPDLLAPCRDLHTAQKELRWLREHVEKVAKARRVKGDTLAKGALLRQLNLPNELRVLDLCTGTGCIPLLFRHEFTSTRRDVDLRMIGVDISDESMKLAHHNLSKVEKSTQTRKGMIDFAKADVLADPFADQAVGAPLPLKTMLNYKRWTPFWDILISNPPYISPSAYWKTTTRSVRVFEPKLALVPPPRSNHDDTQQGDVFYPRLLDIANEVEAKIVLLEIADLEQALRVAQLARETRTFDGVEIWRDEPDASPSQPTTAGGVRIYGEGNARSVVCWRGAGASWLGKTSTPNIADLEQHAPKQMSTEDLSPSFHYPG